MLPVCTLANMALSISTDLPVSFKYLPYVPKKRTSVTRTANSVVTQVAAPTQIVHGDGILSWNIQEARPEEFADLFALYNTVDLVLYDFTGYWNDSLEVYFTDLKIDKVFGRFFSLTGEFQVVSVAPYLYEAVACGY